MKIYLDTTIPSYASSRKQTPEVKITKKLLLRIKQEEFTPYASFLTVAELNKTPSEVKKKKLFTVFYSLNPVIIESNNKIVALAQKYIKKR